MIKGDKEHCDDMGRELCDDTHTHTHTSLDTSLLPPWSSTIFSVSLLFSAFTSLAHSLCLCFYLFQSSLSVFVSVNLHLFPSASVTGCVSGFSLCYILCLSSVAVHLCLFLCISVSLFASASSPPTSRAFWASPPSLQLCSSLSLREPLART